MQAVLLLQATQTGIVDMSSLSRPVVDNKSRVSVIGGYHYYDLGGDTAVRWDMDGRLSLSNKALTIEGWIITPDLKPSPSQYFIGGLANGSWNNGFFVGFQSAGFLFSTGSGTRDYTTVAAGVANQPMHFAWVLSGLKKTLYINGVSVGGVSNATSSVATPEALTFGYAFSQNTPSASAGFSSAKVSQLIIWDGVKYDRDFTPSHVDYGQQYTEYMGVNRLGVATLTASNGVISDKVLIKGLAARRKVCLYRRITNELLTTTWSDHAGNYRFENLDPKAEYYVVALDHERNYNAVIQDMLRAE